MGRSVRQAPLPTATWERSSLKPWGKGYLFSNGIEGLQRGGVLWEVTRGTGGFAGATGVITSNFSVASDGAVVDNHFAGLYLPE
jgi:hypothetical protein